MPADSMGEPGLTQAATAPTAEKTSLPYHIDRPSDAEITAAWLEGQRAYTLRRRPENNPHGDWWLGTAWADGLHGWSNPLDTRGWR